MTPEGRAVRIALAWAGLIALIYLVYRVVEPFLVPLGWAGVLAVIFYPLHERLARRWGPGRASGVTTLIATLVVIVPAVLVMGAFVREAFEATADLQRAFNEGRLDWMNRAWSVLVERIPGVERIDLVEMATSGIQRGAGIVVAQMGFVLRGGATLLLNVVLALFALFFLLRDSEAILRAIRRLIPMEELMREELMVRTRELVAVGVASAVVVAAAQGFLGGLVFAVLRIDAPVFWGVMMGFLCLLPFGAWIVWLPMALVLIVNGEIGRGIVLIVLGVAIVSGADNVLRPMLLSGQSRMNGLVIFLSLLGGLSVFGLLGIVLGPVLVATALALLTAYVETTTP